MIAQTRNERSGAIRHAKDIRIPTGRTHSNED